MYSWRSVGSVAVSVAAASLFAGCSPSAISPIPTPVTASISGNFAERPWSHSHHFSSDNFDRLSVDVTFAGDYNDRLWIELWDGQTMLAQATAQGYFDPEKRIDAQVAHGRTYEIRIWTDKCCTKYEGFVTRAH